LPEGGEFVFGGGGGVVQAQGAGGGQEAGMVGGGSGGGFQRAAGFQAGGRPLALGEEFGGEVEGGGRGGG